MELTLANIKNLDFVTFEYGYRYKISSRKATNTIVLNAVLLILKENDYKFYQLFQGGYIFAEKND